MTLTIGVLISSHTPRWQNGAVLRALNSVADQMRPPDQVAVVNDVKGMGAAWCKDQALSMLSTDLVAVLDSDDFWYNNHLIALEEAFLTTDCDIAYSNWDGNNPFPEEWKTLPWDNDNPRHTSTTIMARRELMIEAGSYVADSNPYSGHANDDWLLMLAMLELGAKVHHVQETTWFYSTDKDNTSGLASRWTPSV